MKKIGILATARERNGGTLLYTQSMIEALRRLPQDHFQWTLFTLHNIHEYDDIGLPIVRLPGAFSIAASRFVGVDLFASVDKVVAPIYSTAILATRRPFAFTLHDLQEKYYPEYFRLPTRIWRYATNRLLTTRASHILCESGFVKCDIMRFFDVPESRIAVIPAPPVSTLKDCAFDVEGLVAVRRKLDLPESFVFYPAQFWPHKNHRRLVEAFAQVVKKHSGVDLVLTGKKRDEYENVFQRVRELGLGSRVHHLGYVEQMELAAVYRCATVVAVPTLFESISLPVYEAFSLGAAVCASNVVALPEQIGDAGLLFDPLSVGDMAEKISILLDDPALRRQLIERGRQRMMAVTQDDYARRLGSVIDALEPQS
ncbi:mannosyl-N-acetyl-alpha-D-glucosaminyl-diphospho-ditrans,octacis-undecaprenol 3-alpha-mannosyltransferase / alpha-1,3-rhamnosyltransferase [Gammaproteobacteria bacterium]